MRIRIRISIRVRTAYKDQDIIRTRTSDWNQDWNKDQDWELVQDPALRLESGSEPMIMKMIRNRTSDEDKHQYQDQYLRSGSAPHIRIKIRISIRFRIRTLDRDQDLRPEFHLGHFWTEFLNQICFIGFLSKLFKNMSKLIKIKCPN